MWPGQVSMVHDGGCQPRSQRHKPSKHVACPEQIVVNAHASTEQSAEAHPRSQTQLEPFFQLTTSPWPEQADLIDSVRLLWPVPLHSGVGTAEARAAKAATLKIGCFIPIGIQESWGRAKRALPGYETCR